MNNPYESPPNLDAASVHIPRSFRVAAIVLAVFAVLIGAIHLAPFLTRPIATWGWQNWWFGFAPAAYLLFAALVAVPCERWRPRFGMILLPIVLSPLLLVTGLILFATYLDFSNIFAGKYSWSQILHSLLILSLCPVVWYYLSLAAVRSFRMLSS